MTETTTNKIIGSDLREQIGFAEQTMDASADIFPIYYINGRPTPTPLPRRGISFGDVATYVDLPTTLHPSHGGEFLLVRLDG
jgi:hypothetical protein